MLSVNFLGIDKPEAHQRQRESPDTEEESLEPGNRSVLRMWVFLKHQPSLSRDALPTTAESKCVPARR